MLFPWCSLPPDWRQLGSLEELVLEAFQSRARGPGEMGGAGHRSGWGWGSGSLASLASLSRLHLQLGTWLPGAHLIGQRLGRIAFYNVPCCPRHAECLHASCDVTRLNPASSFSAAAAEVASAPNLKGIIALCGDTRPWKDELCELRPDIDVTTISVFDTSDSESE